MCSVSVRHPYSTRTDKDLQAQVSTRVDAHFPFSLLSHYMFKQKKQDVSFPGPFLSVINDQNETRQARNTKSISQFDDTTPVS